MENQNNVKISIPKPCHEDWNKMTPNEKGAFCSKCAKTVVDFTKKTTEEISSFLIAETGKKICGRFLSRQLDEPAKKVDLFIPFQLLPQRLSFSNTFIFSLFIVFGTTLFSCSTQQGEVVGKIALAHDTNVETRQSTITGDSMIVDPQTSTGSVVPVTCEPLKGDVAIEMLQGEVAVPRDTVQKDQEKEEMKKGKIKIQEKKPE